MIVYFSANLHQSTPVSILGTVGQKVSSSPCLIPSTNLGTDIDASLICQARALRALGLLLADGAPTVGGGKTF